MAPAVFFLEEVFFLAPAVFLTPVFLAADFFAVFLAAGAFFAVLVFFVALLVVRFFAFERLAGLPGVTALAAVLTASAKSPWKSCAAAAAIPLEVFFLAMCNPHKSYKRRTIYLDMRNLPSNFYESTLSKIRMCLLTATVRYRHRYEKGG